MNEYVSDGDLVPIAATGLSASQAEDAASDASSTRPSVWDALRLCGTSGAIDFAGARITAVGIPGASPFYVIS